jgi:predicted nucleotidyltransferase
MNTQRIATVDQNERLASIAKRMSTLPYADRIKVFGSMARGSDAPGDIDVFVDLSDQPYVDFRQCDEFFALIRIAHKNYALVDPFLRFKDALLVRNDQSTGWQQSKNVRAIKKNMDVEARSIAEVSALYSKYSKPVVETDSSLSL